MPLAYYKTPIGFARITEEDGCITSICLLDGDFEETPSGTPLLKKAVEQLSEYFDGKRKNFDFGQQVLAHTYEC